MSFREYLRWEGALAIIVGTGLYLFGLADGHQGPIDAVSSGAVTVAGTGLFMRILHRAPLRRPSQWFTAKPVAAASPARTGLQRGNLLARLLLEAVGFVAFALGLSYLTGYQMTYMDAGVWAIAIGIIKIGPAAAALAQHETRADTTYIVSRRKRLGLVGLTAGPPPDLRSPARA